MRSRPKVRHRGWPNQWQLGTGHKHIKSHGRCKQLSHRPTSGHFYGISMNFHILTHLNSHLFCLVFLCVLSLPGWSCQCHPGPNHQLVEWSETSGLDGLWEAPDGESGGVGVLGLDLDVWQDDWIGLREILQETIDFPIKYGAFL